MYRILTENTTYFDFGRETWIKNYVKDYSLYCLSGPAFSDRSIQVGTMKLSKGDHYCIIEVTT